MAVQHISEKEDDGAALVLLSFAFRNQGVNQGVIIKGSEFLILIKGSEFLIPEQHCFSIASPLWSG